jgi:hypothetical protein
MAPNENYIVMFVSSLQAESQKIQLGSSEPIVKESRWVYG